MLHTLRDYKKKYRNGMKSDVFYRLRADSLDIGNEGNNSKAKLYPNRNCAKLEPTDIFILSPVFVFCIKQ